METAQQTSPEPTEPTWVVHTTPVEVGNHFLTHEVGNVTSPQVEEILDLGGGAKLRVIRCENHLFLGGADNFPWYTPGTVPNEGEPLLKAVVLGAAKTKIVTKTFEWWASLSSGWDGYSTYGYSNSRH